MTQILQSKEYRNTDDDCTIIIEQYREKGAIAAFWRVLYRFDSCGVIYFCKYRDMLLNKPSKRQIENYCNSL